MINIRQLDSVTGFSLLCFLSPSSRKQSTAADQLFFFSSCTLQATLIRSYDIVLALLAKRKLVKRLITSSEATCSGSVPSSFVISL